MEQRDLLDLFSTHPHFSIDKRNFSSYNLGVKNAEEVII